MAEQPLHECLQRLHQRRLLMGAATGAGWALVAMLALVAVGMWLDLVMDLPPGLRIAAVVVAVMLGIVPVGVAARAAFRGATWAALARRVDWLVNGKGQVAAGADLLTELNDLPPLPRGLARLAVAKAEQLAGDAARGQVVSARPVHYACGGVLVLVAAAVACSFGMPRLAATQWLRFVDPFGDHPRYSRTVFTVMPGNTTVTYGDGLDIYVATEGEPLDALRLVLAVDGAAAQEILPMFPEAGGRWRATIASVSTSLRYWASAASGRSHRYTVEVVTVPRLEEVAFEITPPAYTGQPPYKGPLPQGGIAGLPGTNVRLTARSNRPLSRGTLGLFGGPQRMDSELTPSAVGAREVTGTFELREAGRLEVTVVDVGGQVSKDKLTVPIVLLADERPTVRLLQPNVTSMATPEALVPVVALAEDDYGVSRVQLFRSLNDSRPLPVDLPRPGRSPTRCTADARLPLDAYGLRPGDTIKLFARVEDNDPAGAKGAESPVAVVRIISAEDYQRLLVMQRGMETLQSKYQAAQRQMENLAARIEELQKKLAEAGGDEKLARSAREELAKLAKEMEKAAEEMRKTAGLDLPFDLDRQLKERLDQLADSVGDAARQTRAMQGTPGLTAQEARRKLEELHKKLTGDKKRYEEEVTRPLEFLAEVFAVKLDEARFVALYKRQRDLAERLAALNGRDNEEDPAVRVRMRDLETEQQQVRTALRELLDDIENDVVNLPDDPEVEQLRVSAIEFVKAVRGSSIAEHMQSAEAGLSEFSGTRGYEGALAAADEMDKFLKKCSSMGQQAGQCLAFQPQLSSGLGNTVDQMLDSMGMNSGMDGQGAGGGYSAERSTMQNVGLYGNMPALEQASGSSNGADGNTATAVRPDPSTTDSGAEGEIDQAAGRKAGGTGGEFVPVRYRRSVGRYFQRISDEVGEK